MNNTGIIQDDMLNSMLRQWTLGLSDKEDSFSVKAVEEHSNYVFEYVTPSMDGAEDAQKTICTRLAEGLSKGRNGFGFMKFAWLLLFVPLPFLFSYFSGSSSSQNISKNLFPAFSNYPELNAAYVGDSVKKEKENKAVSYAKYSPVQKQDKPVSLNTAQGKEFYGSFDNMPSMGSFVDKHNLNNQFYNLGFEYAAPGSNLPLVWYVGGFKSDVFKAELDSNIKKEGNKSLRLQMFKRGNIGDFISATNSIPYESFKGAKRIRVEAFLKLNNYKNGHINLWLTGWAPGKNNGAFYMNTYRQFNSKDTSWQKHVIDIEIDSSARSISFGCVYDLEGTVWIDDFKVFVDDEPLKDVQPRIKELEKNEIEKIKSLASLIQTSRSQSYPQVDLPDKFISGKKVIALGNPFGLSKEITELRYAIVASLAAKEKSLLLILESNEPETELLNEYVQGGSGNLRQIIDSIHRFGINNEESERFFEWVREFNATGKGRIFIGGINMTYPGMPLQKINESLSFFKKSFVTKYRKFEKELNQYRLKLKEYDGNPYKISDKERSKLNKSIDNLMGDCNEKSCEMKSEKSKEVTAAVAFNLSLLKQYIRKDNFYFSKSKLSMVNCLDSIYQPQKIVMLTSNSYFRLFREVDPTMFGNHLRNKYRESLLTVCVVAGEGEWVPWPYKNIIQKQVFNSNYPEYIENYLAKIFSENVIIDISAFKNFQDDIREYAGYKFKEKLSDSYDAIIFVPHSTPTNQYDLGREWLIKY